MSKTKKSWIGQPVRVEWVDSMGTSGWLELKPSNMNCTTIGHYHSETEDRITVALNMSHEHGGMGEYMEIPRCAIKRIRRLK